MPRITQVSAGVLVLGLLIAAATTVPASGADGKELFVKNRCRSCHAVKAAAIERKKSAEDEEPAGDRKPPDLSGVGKEHTAAWIVSYLLKKEAIKGEKHPKKFRAAEGELKAIAAWLETMKSDTK
jgi:cbb3-type cytochrome oxidase cytochrome c subunit